MARANLPAKKYKHGNPTQLRLSFELEAGATKFVDIAQALSIVNRKFYRQGVYYYVNSVEIYNNETGVVDLHTLPDTWVTKNAHQRGYIMYQKMNSLVDDMVPRPKYQDFKVYMSDLHRQNGTISPALHNVNASYVNLVADEWKYTQLVSADSDGDLVIDPGTGHATAINQEADNFYLHMIGPHVGTADNWDSVGLIKSYGDSRAEPSPSGEPTMPAAAETDPLVNLFDFSTEEQINDIVSLMNTDNDFPPYDGNSYIGESVAHMQHVARIGTEIGVGRVGRAQGFCAPFGLICVDPSGVTTAFRLVLNLAAGTYHGTYGERA